MDSRVADECAVEKNNRKWHPVVDEGTLCKFSLSCALVSLFSSVHSGLLSSGWSLQLVICRVSLVHRCVIVKAG